MMKIRYSYINALVANVFIKFNIKKYPLDIRNLIGKYDNIRVVSYSKHMNKYSLTSEEVISFFGSEDGCTDYNPKKNRYIIFYNDLDIYHKSEERIRWTFAHELGHILLGHHMLTDKTRIFRNKLSKTEYDLYEVEANKFAALILANPLILDKLNIADKNELKMLCKLSSEAASYRFSDYLKWKNNNYHNKYDTIILQLFDDFISTKHCKICNYGFKIKDSKFCPICGSDKLKWGDRKMYYSKIEINEDGKATICPFCGNEEVVNGGYCQICGNYITNVCTNINCSNYGRVLSGESRYCSLCGEPSTFLQNNILSDWKTAINDIDDDDDMPF